MSKRLNVQHLFIFLITIMLMFGCSPTEGSDSEEPTNPDPSSTETVQEDEAELVEEGEPEPVTLVISTPWDDTMYEDRVKDHVESTFEHITLEHVQIGNRE